uniref:Uncharacterized protein n=1 Tax=Anguilla anguilla TaxID=7936 RepID=A0A0E9TIY9_ANGAN
MTSFIQFLSFFLSLIFFD